MVLVAAAVLSLVAAFIYSRTENQLMLSIASRGQSIAASRATLAAERKLAIYRVNYPPGLATLTPSLDYATAVAAGQVGDREFWNYDKAGYPDPGRLQRRRRPVVHPELAARPRRRGAALDGGGGLRLLRLHRRAPG